MPIIEVATSFLVKIARDSLHDWAKKEGVSLIDELAGKRFSLFGSRRAAISRLWGSVASQVQQPALVAAINAEAKEYLRLPGLLCDYSDNLPEEPGTYPSGSLRALPLCAINKAAYKRLKTAIGSSQLLHESQAQSDILVEYFLHDLAQEFGRQYRKAYENKTPVKVAALRETAGDWTVVSLDSSFPWPPSDIAGHYLVYHAHADKTKGLSRDQKVWLEGQMAKLEAKLGMLDAAAKKKVTSDITFRIESKYELKAPAAWKIE